MRGVLTETGGKSNWDFFVLPAQPILSILFILSKTALDRMNRIYRMGSEDGYL
jgi:hypothetical protein